MFCGYDNNSSASPFQPGTLDLFVVGTPVPNLHLPLPANGNPHSKEYARELFILACMASGIRFNERVSRQEALPASPGIARPLLDSGLLGSFMPCCLAGDSALQSRRLMGVFVAAAITVAGCSGGRSERLIPVSGQLTEAGQPLTRGTISFRPDVDQGNKSLDHPTGEIDSAGRYTLFTAGREGAPAGWYQVVVFCNEPVVIRGKAHPGMPKSLIHERYTKLQTTPLAVEVQAEASPGTYDFKLTK